MIPLLLALVCSHPPTRERTCEACHPAQAQTYAPSAHARSFSNPVFQASWEHVHQRAWCLRCHDPLGGQRGMTCDSCHTQLSERVTDDVCAHCHQFHAPEAVFANVPMQDTVGEWRRSGTRKTCVECHFPAGDHRSLGGHDLPLLQKTLAVRWSKGCAAVEATGAGHAVPTGDPFHFLRFSVCGDAACKVRLGSRTLSRQIAQGADGTWAAALDTRPQPRQEFCFEQPGATHWILEVRHAEAALDARVSADERWKVIHTGELPGPDGPAGN